MVQLSKQTRTTGHRIERMSDEGWTTVVLPLACPCVRHARAERNRLSEENPEHKYRIMEVKTSERIV